MVVDSLEDGVCIGRFRIHNHRFGKKLSFCHFESCSHHEARYQMVVLPKRVGAILAQTALRNACVWIAAAPGPSPRGCFVQPRANETPTIFGIT
jgi:hypothetical protein